MNRKALIILSFIENINDAQLFELSSSVGYIICADGGEDVARKYGIFPNCVIGDFDSAKYSDRFDCKYITLPVEKDLTDTEAAIDYAIELGIHDITVYGGIGGRLDHTLGNIGLLDKYLGLINNLKFIDADNYMELLSSEANYEKELKFNGSYKYFSLLPLDSSADGVTISGAKYNLDNATITRASTLCISNEITSQSARITIGSGKVLLIRSRD